MSEQQHVHARPTRDADELINSLTCWCVCVLIAVWAPTCLLIALMMATRCLKSNASHLPRGRQSAGEWSRAALRCMSCLHCGRWSLPGPGI